MSQNEELRMDILQCASLCKWRTKTKQQGYEYVIEWNYYKPWHNKNPFIHLFIKYISLSTYSVPGNALHTVDTIIIKMKSQSSWNLDSNGRDIQ